MFTKKPSDFITHSVPLDFHPPKCNNDCRFRFPDGSGKDKFHLCTIRLDWRSVPSQVKQQGSMRHAVPHLLFALWFEQHELWLASRLGSANALMVAPIDYNLMAALPHGKGKGSIKGPIHKATRSVGTKASRDLKSFVAPCSKPAPREPIVIKAHPQVDGPSPVANTSISCFTIGLAMLHS